MINIPSYKKINTKLLQKYTKNSRTHSPEQITQIVNSIKEFGFTNPLLIDEKNVLIAGHARLAAATELGINELPCIVLDGLTEAQKKALVIADNKLALNAGWDFDVLRDEINFLQDNNFNIELTGFAMDELAEFMIQPVEGESDPDEVPEIKADPISKLGDVWLLNNHRLMCGDSTLIDDVEKLMNGAEPNIMLTDPPYGVDYDPSWREGVDLGVGERSRGKVQNDDKVDWTDAYSLFSGSVAYVWHAAIFSPDVAQHLRNCDFDIISQIIWVKQHFALSRGDYHWQHEPCWYVVKKGHKHNWQGDRTQSTTWDIKNNNSFGNSNKEETWGHGTQKPMECMERPILNNSKVGDFVYDPFGGSGTTLIASEKTNRKCLMMELSPNYVDVIIRRWQKFTGKDAILESSNQTFKELENGKA